MPMRTDTENDNVPASPEDSFDVSMTDKHSSDTSDSSGEKDTDTSHLESDIEEICAFSNLSLDNESSGRHLYPKNKHDFSDKESSDEAELSSSTLSDRDEITQARLERIEKRLLKKLDSGYSLLCLDICQESKDHEKIYKHSEFVWVNIERLWDRQSKRTKFLNDLRITHWPAFIRNHERNADSRFIFYEVTICALNYQKTLRQKDILPWRALDPTQFQRKVEDSMHDNDLVSNFIQSLDSVKARSAMCYAIDPYYPFSLPPAQRNYISDIDYTQEIGLSKHFKKIMFGPEVLHEGDILRLDSEEAEDSEKRNVVLFKVHYFYYFKRRNRIEMTGDKYQYYAVAEKDDVLVLKKMERAQSLSVVRLDEVVGRYYKWNQEINRTSLSRPWGSLDVLFC
ncbi:10147_t:CDS:1 [Acaulospora colombiana]|uniref:10147_t:CDS:1 n=1 Tax=Acaulospora colombiana TaxID=27376 RepID=A0ACA9MLN1_9GLOM|nr:10147_t:CDS:1 [Acaulospora colombiana]